MFREVCDNHILQILREEKEAKISGGLYHELQVRMTYNSNHIEGSKLTEDSSLDWFAVGDYKKRANTVGGRETCKPSEVHKAMDKLVTDFNSKSNITIDNIIELHEDFEYIHPFQDGNGRVGRLIALKECLRFNIIPFIIENSKKAFYYRGLANRNQENGGLRDTCLDGQDSFKRILNVLDIHE